MTEMTPAWADLLEGLAGGLISLRSGGIMHPNW